MTSRSTSELIQGLGMCVFVLLMTGGFLLFLGGVTRLLYEPFRWGWSYVDLWLSWI